jgi:hypothetical protein
VPPPIGKTLIDGIEQRNAVQYARNSANGYPNGIRPNRLNSHGWGCWKLRPLWVWVDRDRIECRHVSYIVGHGASSFVALRRLKPDAQAIFGAGALPRAIPARIVRLFIQPRQHIPNVVE